MPLLTNGNDKLWLACCHCPEQPPAVERTGRSEYDSLRALAQAKAAGWLVKQAGTKWLGLCPTCAARVGGQFPEW